MVGDHELLLAFSHQTFETTNALATGNKLALSDGNLLLELCVLLHQLSLHQCELLQVAFKECELLLLLLAVRATQNGVVLLTCRVKGNFQLDHTLAAVLQVAHKRLLDSVEVGELLVHRSAVATGQ